MALGPVFLIAVVLSGVVSDRSARILNRSETSNDIKHGAENVSVVLGTNASTCNSTLCGMAKVRRVPLKLARNFTISAGRRNDGFRQPSRGLLPPLHSGSDLGDYSHPKPQQDAPTSGYTYPKPQEDYPTDRYVYPKPKPEDEHTSGYSYPKPKPQQDDPANGYFYPKPKPHQDVPSSGYSYPRPEPQQDESSSTSGYSYPKPQQNVPSSGYSYPRPEPQQDEPSSTSGYSYPKPQQNVPSSGYSYPRPEPQQDEPSSTSGYSYPKPQQNVPSSGYSYPRPEPQQDEPTNGYSYPKPKPEQDTLNNGYSYPKPQLDEPSDGYSYPKPYPQEDEVNTGYSYPKQQTASDSILDDYRKRYQPGSSNHLVNKKEVQSWSSVSSWDYSTQANINSWKPMFSRDVNRLSNQQTTSAPQTSEDESIDIPVPHDTLQDTPGTALVPPGRDEPPWNLYAKPIGEGSLGNAYGPPQNDPVSLKPTYGPPARPTRPPLNDPADSYLPPQNDPLIPKPIYGTPSRPPQNDPADSYLTPQNDPFPIPIYGPPPTRPTRPPQNDQTDSYLPPQYDPLPPKPTYGPPSRPTRPPQNDPADSYLPPQNDPLPPKPTHGLPARPTCPPQNDPADSYLPPQNDPLPPIPTYGPPSRPARPPQNDQTDSYLPPQYDPLPPKPTYGPPSRPTRPPQNDPADSYLPPQNDPLPPKPTYGLPARPTRPPQNDPADSYLPPQNDPLPPKPTYGPPARPTRPPQNDPADSYLPPQNDPLPPVPTYGPPSRPTRPPQNDPGDSYLPPQNDAQPPKPTYGPPSRPTRPPQNDPTDSYLPPQNDPLPPKPIYGVPARPTRPPQNDQPPSPVYGVPSRPPLEDPVNSYLPPESKPSQQFYGLPQEATVPPAIDDTPPTSYWPEIEDNKSFREFKGEYLSPSSIGAPSGSFDDSPSPVYVPYHSQDDSDIGRQGNLPHDGSRATKNSVLRVPGGLQPSDIHVTDLRCWRSAPSSVFAFTLWTTKKMASSPVLVSADSSSACRIRADTTAPRSRYLIRLAHTDLARCGVRPCTNNGEERMCVTLQLPHLTGIRLASDPQLEVSCAPPPQSDWSIKQFRMAAAAPPLGPPELRVKGGRSPLHTQLLLYRRTAPGGIWRRVESSQPVVLGEELQLRALVRGGDGWQSSKLGDVMVRRTNTGEDLKSTATLSDSTSAISARLLTSEGCPNPDMEDVTGLQSWLAGDPLVSILPIRVFMFRGQKDGEQIVISARVIACQDRLHCKMEPRQCGAANSASRVKRSTLNEDEKNSEMTTSEAEISLRVILPKSGKK